ncbi:uncharacterized protein PRCAT00006230001 [Priceomyces carsonii]|uniref:uncharacterized protein n=1 Tax=Priceomyces carsonii TaxID=28549 RepID=UPI002EDAB6C8|nr:unnamed protein product [Priceomyces carsonii]
MSNTSVKPPSGMKMDIDPKDIIKLLTFNTWGLKYISKFRRERFQALAERLSNPSPGDEFDIVALQEVWCQEDWDTIEESCKNLYPYRRLFKSGIVTGPGLALLSKIPIEETFLYRFPINGRPSAFYRGDWFVGKSVAVTLLKPHRLGATPVAVMNSHMHAPYGVGDNSYSCHRACQAWDITRIIKILKRSGYAVIQVGDLNSKPGSLPYELFRVEGGLMDSWKECSKETFSNEEIASMNPTDQVTLGGITCDSQLNTWRSKRKRWEACRLDYALIDPKMLAPISAAVKFFERLPEPYNCSFSDHFAYSVNLRICNKDEFREKFHCGNLEKLTVYKQLISEIEEYRTYTIPFQASWRKIYFITSMAFVVAMHVVIGFVSSQIPFLSVLLLFVTVFAGITGVINGLIWYCSVRSELRALDEVQNEVEDLFASVKNK